MNKANEIITNLDVFKSEEFGSIRVTNRDNEPWFVGKDVAQILGYKDTSDALKRHVDEEDKGVGELPTPGGKQNLIIINESGLYSLILSSKLPNAKKFKRWVTSEVLPAIRQNGFYFSGMSKELQAILLVDKKQQANERKINAVAEDLKDFKENAPLFSIECEELQKALKKKLVHLLGGKQSPAYRDNSIRQRAFIDAQHQIKREFAVSSYKGIKRVHFEKAMEIIENYTLPTALQEVVTALNCQVCIQAMMSEKDNLIRGAFGK